MSIERLTDAELLEGDVDISDEDVYDWEFKEVTDEFEPLNEGQYLFEVVDGEIREGKPHPYVGFRCEALAPEPEPGQSRSVFNNVSTSPNAGGFVKGWIRVLAIAPPGRPMSREQTAQYLLEESMGKQFRASVKHETLDDDSIRMNLERLKPAPTVEI